MSLMPKTLARPFLSHYNTTSKEVEPSAKQRGQLRRGFNVASHHLTLPSHDRFVGRCHTKQFVHYDMLQAGLSAYYVAVFMLCAMNDVKGRISASTLAVSSADR